MQPVLRVCAPDRIDDFLVTEEWPTTPVHADERRPSVFDLIGSFLKAIRLDSHLPGRLLSVAPSIVAFRDFKERRIGFRSRDLTDRHRLAAATRIAVLDQKVDAQIG
jgi:hypothetical protein